MSSSPRLLVLLVLASLLAIAASLDLRNKAMVQYGGFTFLLKDGCPPQTALESFDAYDKRVSAYNACITSQDLKVQCETDQFNPKQTITVPAFSDQCSAACHGAVRNADCPYPGRRLAEGQEAKNDVSFVDANLG